MDNCSNCNWEGELLEWYRFCPECEWELSDWPLRKRKLDEDAKKPVAQPMSVGAKLHESQDPGKEGCGT